METNSSEIRFEGCGDIIRDARLEAGFTLRQLATESGCNHSRISKVESNALALSLTMIEQIAKGLKISPEQIVLKCLETKFPKMRSTQAGKKIVKFLSTVDDDA